MVKKFTFFFVAATALLLTLTMPATAQQRDYATKAAPGKLMRGAKGCIINPAVTIGSAVQQTTVGAGPVPARIKADKARQAKRQAADARQAKQQATSSRHAGRRTSYLPAASLSRPASIMAKVEAKDDHGIITSPAEGQRKVYARSGWSYQNSDGLMTVDQDGTVQIVECEDGTVYIRNILYSFPTGTWVKGTREGSTITVPAAQPVYWNANAETTYSIRWGICEDGMMFSMNGLLDSFTFDVNDDEGTIALRGSSAENFMGLFWDDDFAFAWQGDYETVWTYQGDYQPMPVVTVTPPAGLTTETWYTKGHLLIDDELVLFKSTMTIGFSGEEVYLKIQREGFADAWMKGVISGETVTFSGLQSLGTLDDEDNTPLYAVGCDGNDLADFVMTYDAEAKTLTSQNILLANAAREEVSAQQWISDITISLVDPFAPIETLPYYNSFETQDEWDWFTVEDANGDGSTWRQFEGTASYHYNSENPADDWLFSPAFRLEAGKIYHLALGALASSEAYEEKFEVKMGTAAQADAMTSDVIGETIVDWEGMAQTIENRFITVAETGVYYFGIHAISPEDCASLRIDDFLMEETILTAPAAATDLTVTADAEKPMATITFRAPTTNIGGETLTANMTLIELLRDGEVITTFEDVAPGQQITYVDADESLSGTTYKYQVVAYNADGRGVLSEIVSVRLNMVFHVPYLADFTHDAVGGQFTQINANDDGSFWEWDGGIRATYSYSSDNNADDYLVSPALHLDAGKRYNIIVDAGSAGYPERFEVLVGREPTAESLNMKVLEDCVVELEDTKLFECTFAAPETGAYYVAVHCISDADQYELWVNKLSVELAPELTAPAAPTLAVTPGAEGTLQTTITITAPTTSVDGNTLTANLTKMELYRNDMLLKEFDDVAPGATLTYVDSDIDEAALFTYRAIPYNADGIGMKSDMVKAFVGPDAPDFVKNVKAVPQGDKVLLTWDKVTAEGRNGGYVNPAEVEYVIYACEFNTSFIASDAVATVTDADSYLLDYDPNEGEQGYQIWGVTARYKESESFMESESYAQMTVGTPYELPVVEGFADGSFHYYCDYVGTPLVFGLSSDDDGTAIALVSQTENSEVVFAMGKMTLKGAANPVLLVDAAGFGVSSFHILATTDGRNATELGTFTIGDTGYKTIRVPLNEYKDADYVMLAMTATIATPTTFDLWTGEIEEQGDAIILDNIRVIDLYEHNLTVAMTAPAAIQAGREAAIAVTVTNWGEKPAKDFTVTVTAHGSADVPVRIHQETVTEELAPFSSIVIPATLTTSILDEAGDWVIKTTVDYAADQKQDDNTAEAIVTITEPTMNGPESLTAAVSAASPAEEASVDLNWTAPSAEPQAYTEDFESTDAFPTFQTGGISATEPGGQFGEWTVYDGNGTEVYSWNDPNVIYANQYGPYAWMPFDLTEAGLGVWQAHSGNQLMLSMCPADGAAADHWLISPQLPGTAQTISFFARAITDSYGAETLEVLVSSTDNKPESFTAVVTDASPSGTFSITNVDWQEFSADLPEGTKYFALRHTSTDIFGLMIDDMNFSYGSDVTAYNIYSDGRLIATVSNGETTYTVEAGELEDGEHTFAVTAIYANGQESRPATATLTVTVGISDLTANAPAESPAGVIYSLDGKRVSSNAKSLKGTFIINNKKVTLK